MKLSILTDANGVVTGYGVCLSEEHKPLPNGVIIQTDIDPELLIGNYKLVDGALVELSKEEKPLILPEPTAEERIEALEAALLEVVLDG